MVNKISRRKQEEVKELLTLFPAVLILGQRQVGKTTLALDVAKESNDFHYVDLSDPEELGMIRSNGAGKYVKGHGKQLTVLDGVQIHSELFRELLPVINERMLAGKANGSFLLLGSTSLEMANRSQETLTGRIGYVDLNPLDIMEIPTPAGIEKLWLRGGLPGPFTADSDQQAFVILSNLARNLSWQEILEQGVPVTRDKVLMLLKILASHQGMQPNKRKIAYQLELNWRVVDRCLGLLNNLLLVRELPAYSRAAVKNFRKRPRIYYRDSGLLHQLLQLPSMTKLKTSRMAGTSWEGFVIENILRLVGFEVEGSYFRTRENKSEMDLILQFQTGAVWAIEIKKGSPEVSRSFYTARDSIKPDRCFIVHGLPSLPRIKNEQGVEIISLPEICREVADAASIL